MGETSGQSRANRRATSATRGGNFGEVPPGYRQARFKPVPFMGKSPCGTRLERRGIECETGTATGERNTPFRNKDRNKPPESPGFQKPPTHCFSQQKSRLIPALPQTSPAPIPLLRSGFAPLQKKLLHNSIDERRPFCAIIEMTRILFYNRICS